MDCPKCERKLKKVFTASSDDLAEESLNGEIILGNCGNEIYNYYCEYCDEYFSF